MESNFFFVLDARSGLKVFATSSLKIVSSNESVIPLPAYNGDLFVIIRNMQNDPRLLAHSQFLEMQVIQTGLRDNFQMRLTCGENKLQLNMQPSDRIIRYAPNHSNLSRFLVERTAEAFNIYMVRSFIQQEHQFQSDHMITAQNSSLFFLSSGAHLEVIEPLAMTESYTKGFLITSEMGGFSHTFSLNDKHNSLNVLTIS